MTLYGLLRRPTIKIAINRPNVAPVPPKFTNESKKGQYKELLYLLLKLLMFASIAGTLIVCINGSTMLAPCKPKNHKNGVMKANNNADG